MMQRVPTGGPRPQVLPRSQFGRSAVPLPFEVVPELEAPPIMMRTDPELQQALAQIEVGRGKGRRVEWTGRAGLLPLSQGPMLLALGQGPLVAVVRPVRLLPLTRPGFVDSWGLGVLAWCSPKGALPPCS